MLNWITNFFKITLKIMFNIKYFPQLIIPHTFRFRHVKANNKPLFLYCLCNIANALSVLIYIRERTLFVFGPRTLNKCELVFDIQSKKLR